MNGGQRVLRKIVIISIALLVGYYFGVNKVNLDWKNYKPEISVVNKQPPSSISNVDFSLFWQAFEKLENNYYDKTKLDPQKMLNGAITGMVKSIGDPYTLYLPPVQTKNFKDGLAGQFSGIGAELGIKGDENSENQQIIVIAPLTGSPAEKAGIVAGDIILKVDGQAVFGWTLQQAVDRIRGPRGTPVALTIRHQGAKNTLDIKIVRDVINIKSVEGTIKKVKGVPIAYIRLSQFGDQTNKEWLNMVNSLSLSMKKNNTKGIVLDLRNNPGGYLPDAVFVASEFLKQDVPVVLEEDGGLKRTTLSVNRNGLFTDNNIPLMVLINKGSASASEIVSGAIRDNKRGVLVGETSFGKGTIQEASDFENGGSIHITIAKWLTPKGTWVNEKGGLVPDVAVALDTKNPSHDVQLEKAVEELVK